MTYNVPSYSDLRRCVRNLFHSGYHIGKINISTCNRPNKYACFLINGSQELPDPDGEGAELSDPVADVTLRLSENKTRLRLLSLSKWNTNNDITTDLSVNNVFGALSIGGFLRYNLEAGLKGWNGYGNLSFKNIAIDSSVYNGGDKGVTVESSIVAGKNGFTAGYQLEYQIDEGKGSHEGTVGFLGDNGSDGFLLSAKPEGDVTASFYQRICPNIELGAIIKPLNGEEGPLMDLATKYTFESQGITLRGKMNNKSELTVSCETKVTEGMSVFFSSAVDVKEFNSGTHKFGLGLGFYN